MASATGLVSAQAPQPVPNGPAVSNPESGKGRIPMISATGRTPAEIAAAAEVESETETEPAVKGEVKPAEEAGGQAKIPFRELMRIAKSDTKPDPKAKFYTLNIKSNLPEVKPAEIELYLDIPGGKMAMPVSQNGTFQVPYSIDTIDMYEQNPFMVANQPRGSLAISVEIEFPEIDPPKVVDGRVDYQELFRPVIEMGKEMAKANPNFGKDGQQQFALQIITEGGEPVILKRKLGSRTLRPNADGKIYLIFERLLFDENPMVLVPEKITVDVTPVTSKEAALIRSQ